MAFTLLSGPFPQPLQLPSIAHTGCLGNPGSTNKEAVDGDRICDSARNFHPVRHTTSLLWYYSKGHGNEECGKPFRDTKKQKLTQQSPKLQIRPWHRSFHATADSYIRQYGRQVFDDAYTFAVVRHPLPRQVSNFLLFSRNVKTKAIAVKSIV